jgi:hypothetical protein
MPVNGSNDGILGEWGGMSSVDSPNSMAPALHIISWYIEGVVEGGNDKKQPGENTEDFVRPNCLGWVGLASCEGIHCEDG